MRSNLLQGFLPTDIDLDLPKLIVLALGNNYFEGHIPFSLSNVSFLKQYMCLTNCTNFEAFSIFGNLFSGSLPNSISNFSIRLSYLSIARKEIHGTIPSDIKNRIGLTRLVLEDNFLEGSIPVVIAKISKLQEIYVGGTS